MTRRGALRRLKGWGKGAHDPGGLTHVMAGPCCGWHGAGRSFAGRGLAGRGLTGPVLRGGSLRADLTRLVLQGRSCRAGLAGQGLLGRGLDGQGLAGKGLAGLGCGPGVQRPIGSAWLWPVLLWPAWLWPLRMRFDGIRAAPCPLCQPPCKASDRMVSCQSPDKRAGHRATGGRATQVRGAVGKAVCGPDRARIQSAEPPPGGRADRVRAPETGQEG